MTYRNFHFNEVFFAHSYSYGVLEQIQLGCQIGEFWWVSANNGIIAQSWGGGGDAPPMLKLGGGGGGGRPSVEPLLH